MFNEKIENDGKIYAVKVNPFSGQLTEQTYWFGKEIFPLQGSLMCYSGGKVFKTHKHKENIRVIQKTQEAFVVVSGKIKVTIYHENQSPGEFPIPLGSLEASKGEMIMVFRGFHKLEFLEHGMCYELKSGQMNSEVVEDDKEFLEG